MDLELQAARLTDLGSLVPGLVHELGNPAAVLRANLGAVVDHTDTLAQLLVGLEQGRDASTLREDLELDEAAADLTQLVSESAGALDDLVTLLGEIRRYAAGAGDDLGADVTTSVASALRLARYETKYRAAMSVEIADLPLAALAPVHLSQVVLALVLNAAQATAEEHDGRGRLGRVSVTACADSPDVLTVEVCDDGPGVGDDVAPHLFDPGFTTRPGSRGMGLYHARQIVEAAGGALVLDTFGRGGARFLARLPAIPDPSSSEAIDPVHKT